ncbi:hypothetical protein AMJ50_02925 [Parcubacteria bacterium DG_74_3]|nr:MAG: hypothetical protein AMJ50_02925 [Parcubacteria bacterium DG_74_3]
MKKLVLSRDFQEIIEEIIKSIKRGKVVVCPTDTVYGLLCDATNKKAINKLFQVKKRAPNKPIPIFIKDIKMAKNLALINKPQEKFLKKVWPGKVTVILKAKKKFPKEVLSKEKKIGLRIPNYKPLHALLSKINFPLSGTSANISGKPASTQIKKIINQFKKEKIQPDLILDAGNLKRSKPSTVVDLTSRHLKILRPGEVKKERLIKIFL